MTEETTAPLPAGEYAIVEVMGHRKYVGRITEVERFGVKMLAIEPLFDGTVLPAVMLGGASIFQLTPVTVEVAAASQPRQRWELPSAVSVTLPPEALPAPDDQDIEDAEFEEIPDFLSREG